MKETKQTKLEDFGYRANLISKKFNEIDKMENKYAEA